MVVNNSGEYLQKVNKIIERKLKDNTFTVQELAKKSGCSRMSLYRKLKKQTGFSPNQYILFKRLQKSTEYLAKSNKSIREISKSLGFSQPSYFAKKFKAQYGCTPSEFINMTKNKHNE